MTHSSGYLSLSKRESCRKRLYYKFAIAYKDTKIIKERVHVLKNLPSQNRVTSVRLSLLNKFKDAVNRFVPKLFHLRQNCC